MQRLRTILNETAAVTSLFPFALVLDDEGRVLEAGESLSVILPEIAVGKFAGDFFEIMRPKKKKAWTKEFFESNQDKLVILRIGESKYRLRCQVVVSENQIAILGSPAIVAEEQLENMGLKFSHFAINDPVVDTIFYFCAQSQAVRQAESMGAELVRNQRRFQQIFEHAGNAIFLHGIDQRIRDVNQKACEIYGHSKSEFCKLKISDIDSSYDAEAIAKMLQQISQETDVNNTVIQTTHLRKNGEEFPAEIRANCFAVSEQESLFISMIVDVTERQAFENQLKIARDQAIHASEAKSNFVASMSHELRTPLNGIIGMTQLLEKTKLDPKQSNYLKACRASGETLLTVIGDILDFSKIEAGKLQLDNHEMDLVPIIESVVQVMSLRTESDDVEIACFIDPVLDQTLIGDSDRLRQILFNLIGNAVKFTHKGQIVVSARPAELNSSFVEAEFAVSDSGIGIPEDRLASLFEAFSQVDSSTTRQYGGTGLGLTITQQLVELMDGTIEVESELDEGSTFRFRIKFPTASHENELSVDHQNKLASIEGLRVAVLDMRGGVSNVLRELFDAWNVNHEFFYTRRAVDQIPDLSRFDVVLINYYGQTDNFGEILACAKEIDPSTQPTMIPLCAPGEELSDSECKELGLAPTLVKPLCQSRLFNALIESNHWGEHTSQIESEPGSASLSQSARILLVEDNKVNQMFAQEVFNDAGFEHLTCDNGQIAVDTLLKDSQFDVILMDCHMPVLDGFEATRRIRELNASGELPEIPIIALTANALAGDKEKCLDAGMDNYLAKPYGVDELLEMVNELLNNEHETIAN